MSLELNPIDYDNKVILPASYAQERLWFLDQLTPGTAVYNMPMSIRLQSRVRKSILARCLTELIRRHETLRSTFMMWESRLVQVISPPYPIHLSFVDLRLKPQYERESSFTALATKESCRPFQLLRGPLLRATLYQLSASEQVLLIVMHHIISDAWSIEVLMKELTALYAAFDSGYPSPLKPLTIQYADWAHSQRECLDSGAMETGIEFWRKQLAGAPRMLELPSDRTRPKKPSYKGGYEYFSIDAELTEQLRDLAQKCGCTLYMLLLAAFGVLLGSYTGKSDLLIGSPLTNRNTPEVESLIGIFLNTVVMRIELDRTMTVRDLLEHVRRMVLAAQTHAEVPLDKLIEVLGSEREHNQQPLFQVLFSLQASASASFAQINNQNTLRNNKSTAPPPTTETSKFDLSLLMTDGSQRLNGAWEYSVDLFNLERVRRFSSHYLNILSGFVREPDLLVSNLSMMDAASERELAVLEQKSGHRRENARTKCVHELVAQLAQLTPNAIAIEAGITKVTYAELMCQVDELCDRLRIRGVGPEISVGICLQRNVNLVVGVLAVLQAGGAYVPLDPKNPKERHSYIAKSANLTYVVTDKVTATTLPPQLEQIRIDISEEINKNLLWSKEVFESNLAYILYTSGTTGQPKGVAVPHHTVNALLDWATRALEQRVYSRVLASTSICFDLSVFELFLPLTCGGTVVLVENVLSLAASDAPDITLVNTVPSAMRELVRIWKPSANLCSIFLAGEALSTDLVQSLHDLAPGVAIYNLYGPTETTVYSTGIQLHIWGRTIPSIGSPIDGTAVYVLNDNLMRIPIGVPGELYIGGAGVARGYAGQPAQTAERYLPDPFTRHKGSRMYRTGDIASWRADGTLEFHGRIDQQVKLRGHRIELGEIELALRKHLHVREAIVSLREAPSGDKHLVAYLTTEEPIPPIYELEDIARQNLPVYMIPSNFVFLQEFPKTATGKINKLALPEPEQNIASLTRKPIDGIETVLCRLFAEALGVSEFDPDKDFFCSGGHSLLATSVVARTNEILGLELPLSAIFDHPSPARLSEFTSTIDRKTTQAAPKYRGKSHHIGPIPLSFAQEGMWFYDRLQSGTALYNLPLVIPIQQSIEYDFLQRSVDYLVAHHEALRTGFDMVDGEPVQKLINDATIKVVLYNLSEIQSSDPRNRAQWIIERESRRPFNLRKAPLMRVALLQLSSFEQILLIVMHHIICDGWSINILLRDIASCYDNISSGVQPVLPDLPIQYSDYVLWQRDPLTHTVLEKGIEYFREQLDGAPALISLPTDHSRPSRPTFRGDIISFRIAPDVCTEVAKFATERGVTQHMFYFAVFTLLLHRYSDQQNVVVGIPVANRSRPEWKNLIGLFTNTLPIRIDFSGKIIFDEVIEHVRDVTVGAYTYEDVAFDRLVQELSPARDLGYHPIFQVMFGFQEIDTDETAADPDVNSSTGTAKFDLSINLSRSDHHVFGMFEYATDLFDRESIERILNSYLEMVKAFPANAGIAMDTVAPLSSRDRTWCNQRRNHKVVPDEAEGSRELLKEQDRCQLTSIKTDTIVTEEITQKIIRIWSEILKHSEFDMDKSFFEVGGHSLAAVIVTTKISEEFGVDLPLESVFLTPTIRELVRVVELAARDGNDEDKDHRPVLRRYDRSGSIALSFAQERLWFLDQLMPDVPVYNIPFSLTLEGIVDIGALERSLERLGDRHESFRARFVSGEERPELVFEPVMQVDLSVSDLSKLTSIARDIEARRIQAIESRRLFDLSNGPLLRAHLVHLDARNNLLFLTVHHIIADAKSVDIIKRDLLALYKSEQLDVNDGLPELSVQYADFGIWQRGWLGGEWLKTELQYWRNKLADAPLLLNLPTDKPRPSEQNYLGKQIPLVFGVDESDAVRRLAKEEGATPFMVLLSIFGAVLGRWSGTSDLVIGTPVTGRPRRVLEELVGFFSNTLPLRFRLNSRQSFRELVREVREVVIEGLGHQEVPFEAIVQELQPERSLAYNPLFQVMLAFQKPDPLASVSDSSGNLSNRKELAQPSNNSEEFGTAKFDLTLFLVDEIEIYGAIEFRTDLFETSTIERFATQLCSAAKAVMASPDIQIAHLFTASDPDIAAISEWNKTDNLFPERKFLAGELVNMQALKTPNAPAVTASGKSWTYAELLHRAFVVAEQLREVGVGMDSRVAIAVEPSPELIAATLGVWLAGGACVPLDPSYPKARLEYMVKDCRASWLVGTEDSVEVTPFLKLINVDNHFGDSGESFTLTESSQVSESASNQLAYIVYTSGSTGQPKGVAMTHEALVNLILWQRDDSEFRLGLRTLQFASPSFDVFFQEMLLCLATGGCLVIAEPELRRDPVGLIQLCRKHCVERLFLPYVALRQIAEIALKQETLPNLCEVITAGEQLQITPAIRKWMSTNPSCRLINQYGPSETHVVTQERLPADPAEWSTLPPIGRTIANARAYVLDEDLQLLPVGVPGDLYLGGISLARGYLDKPALTAERFLPDPYSVETGSRMYQSGDRVRQLQDGRIEFLGRTDNQVKIRGYRVETGEVEAALASLPGVKQAVVIATTDVGCEARLVAYVLSDKQNQDLLELRKSLYEILPEPLVPAILVRVEEFPRTPSGKVDRHGLPKPQNETRVYSDPTNEIERVVSKIWCEVLQLEQVGVEDDFFSIGGHSLLMMRVIVLLNEQFATDVSVRSMYQHSTIKKMASVLDELAVSRIFTNPESGRSIESVPRDGRLIPMSFAQERLWFLDRIDPGNPAYNLTSSYILSTSLNVSLLNRSLAQLTGRHESLRTFFGEVDGELVQIIEPPSKRATMEIIDISFLPRDKCQKEVQFFIEDEARASFDLETGPLFRATLLNMGNSGYVLLLSMHHIISDALSMNILHRELLTIYEALEIGARPSLPVLKVQYADFAIWQRKLICGQVLNNLIFYWRNHLGDAPQRIQLLTHRNHPVVRTVRGNSYSFELDKDVVKELKTLARNESATLFMITLALYFELLYRYSGQNDFLIGAPIGVRQRAELEGVVGIFVNTLVLRANLLGNPNFRQLLQRVRTETMEAYAHADLPFERLVEELRPRRDLGFSPLIQVAFGLNHITESSMINNDSEVLKQISASIMGNGTSKFELSLVMTEVSGRLLAVFEYDDHLFDVPSIERMTEHFKTLTRECVTSPDVPLSQHNLITEHEARKIKSWEQGVAAPAEEDLSNLIASHAKRDPRKIAIEAPDGALDYAQFNDSIERFSRALRALGVTTETRVGVCLGNSMYLPISMIAILRAGGAYVPLDPALPTSRLLHLIDDATVEFIIADQCSSERLHECRARILHPDKLNSEQYFVDQNPVNIEPDQIAYVVYTSGSTGQPKGVMATRSGLLMLITAQLNTLGLRFEDRVLKFATQSFDASIFEMMLAFSAGSTLCLEAQNDLLPGPEFLALLRRRKITMITLPPSSLGVLTVESCPELRLIFVAGESCSSELVKRWAVGRRMVNGYGPTETTVWATFTECTPDGRRPAIGKPVANAVVRVLDDNLCPVPVGIPGEVFIGSQIVARGYIGRPDLTAESFLPDPFGIPGSRMYRTGDLAQWREDGNLDFLGRRDGQVKLRGVRIELSEVENVVSKMPNVAYCVVVMREDQPGNQALVAYVVPEPSEKLDGDAIKLKLQDQLPRFLVPSRILICSELPRTPSGKINLQALPIPPIITNNVSSVAQNSLENLVCRICTDVLGTPIGLGDNFFEHGGHSLLVMRVLSRIREDLGISVSIGEMLKAATLAEFCEGLEAQGTSLATQIPRLQRIAGVPTFTIEK